MEVTAKCKNCEDKELTGTTSIQDSLDQIQPLEEINIAEWEGLKVALRPVKYKSTIEAGLINFQTTRSLQGISELPDDMDKLKIFNETFNRIAVLNFNLIADSIEKIIMQEGEETIEVTDREHIIEFLNNCEASIGKKIEEQSSKISTNGIKKDIQFLCEDCEEVTESTIVLDPVNFFMAS